MNENIERQQVRGRDKNWSIPINWKVNKTGKFLAFFFGTNPGDGWWHTKDIATTKYHSTFDLQTSKDSTRQQPALKLRLVELKTAEYNIYSKGRASC